MQLACARRARASGAEAPSASFASLSTLLVRLLRALTPRTRAWTRVAERLARRIANASLYCLILFTVRVPAASTKRAAIPSHKSRQFLQICIKVELHIQPQFTIGRFHQSRRLLNMQRSDDRRVEACVEDAFSHCTQVVRRQQFETERFHPSLKPVDGMKHAVRHGPSLTGAVLVLLCCTCKTWQRCRLGSG